MILQNGVCHEENVFGNTTECSKTEKERLRTTVKEILEDFEHSKNTNGKMRKERAGELAIKLGDQRF